MPEESSDIKVVIVEDDSEIRKLLTIIIDSSPGYKCIQTFADCESAVMNMESFKPDVVLMDITLPKMDGIQGVAIMKEKLPSTDFIMLTVRDDDTAIFESLCAGATGYLLKETPPVEILQSVKEVNEGGSPMSAAIARKVIHSFRKNEESPLSKRETDILQKLCDGSNYKVIADELFISGNTVRAHIKNIYRKLQVSSRAEAVKKAIHERLI